MENFLGQIIMFAGNYDIQGYISCRGQLMSIANYSALFSLLGTTYGGDGQVTFALPNLQGRMPIGQGNGSGLPSYEYGEMGGTNQTTLIITNLPAHNHPVTFNSAIEVSDITANADEPANSFLTATSSNFYASQGKSGQHLNGFSVHGSLGISGSNAPFSTTPPYLTIGYQICLEGIYPSRN